MALCLYLSLHALCGAGVATAGVLGESIQPYVSFSTLTDSNFFRRSEDEQSNTRLRTALGIDADLLIARQAVVVNANLNFNHFSKFDALDHTGGKADISWRWQLGNPFSGELGYLYDRDLTTFEQFQAPIRDMTTNQGGFVEVGYNASQRLRFRGALRTSYLAHSEETRKTSDENRKEASLAILYRTRPGTFVGVSGSFLDGKYPNRQFTENSLVDNGYEQMTAGLIVEWEPSAKTRVDTQVGYTQRNQDHLAERDSGALSWRIDLTWQMTGKTMVRFLTAQEIMSVDNRESSFAREDLVRINPVWQPTPKLALELNAAYRHLDFAGNVETPQERRQDDHYVVALGADYTLVQNLHLIIDFENGARNSTEPDLDFNYWQMGSGLTLKF